MQRYSIANFQIQKIDNYYLRVSVGQVDYIVHGDDLYLALTAALIGGQAEAIPALASTSTAGMRSTEAIQLTFVVGEEAI